MVVQHAGDGPEVGRGLGGQRQAEQTAAGLNQASPASGSMKNGSWAAVV